MKPRGLQVGCLVLLWGWTVMAQAQAVRHGNVTYRTSHDAYLNAGRLDGVQVNDTLTLLSVDGTRTPCTVDRVADHAARCVGKGLPTHAMFEILHAATPRPVARAFHVPTLTALRRDRAILAAVTMPRVPFTQRDAVPRFLRRRLWVSVGHELYGLGRSYQLNRQVERLDMNLRGVPLGFGDLSASLRMSALAWTVRQPQVRFRPDSAVQLYVWQGEVDRRAVSDSVVLSVGRILPWHVPGLAVLDGAQLGLRDTDAQTEAGVFAGALPDMMTLEPLVGRWSLGGYAMATRKLGHDTVWSNSGRLAFVTVPETGGRGELEWLSWLSVGKRLNMAFNPRLGASVTNPKLMLDALRGDVVAQFGEHWTALGSARWQSAVLVLQDGFLTSAFRRSTAYYNGSVRYAPTPFLAGAVTSVIDSSAGGVLHVLLGPELSLPRLLGGLSAVSMAYLYETGSAQGQSVYLQGNVQPCPDVWVWLRVSYFLDPFMSNRYIRELSLSARVDARLNDLLSLSGAALVRPGLPNPTFQAATLTSVSARLALSMHL